jgi:cobalt-zinc-cadmium resistance protein CzcA
LYWQQVNRLILKEDSVMQIFVKAANLRFKTGESSQLESLLATTKQQEMQQQLIKNQSFINIEKHKLTLLLNITTNFTIIEKDFVAFENSAFYGNTLDDNPTLQLAKQEMATSEAARNVQKAEQKPEFKAGYFIQSLTGNQEVDNKVVFYNGVPRFQGVNLGVSIPIFGRSSNSAKLDAAATNILMQQKNIAFQNASLQALFLQENEQLEASKSQLDYYQKTALPNAAIINKNAQKAYLNGDISYIEYWQNLQTANGIQRNYIDALQKYNQSVINLQYLMNK